jgi:hypothetical protein
LLAAIALVLASSLALAQSPAEELAADAIDPLTPYRITGKWQKETKRGRENRALIDGILAKTKGEADIFAYRKKWGLCGPWACNKGQFIAERKMGCRAITDWKAQARAMGFMGPPLYLQHSDPSYWKKYRCAVRDAPSCTSLSPSSP